MITRRIQLDFSEAGYEDLEAIRAQAGVATKAAAIGNAIAIYKWYLETTGAGGEILVRAKDGQVEKIVFRTRDGRR